MKTIHRSYTVRRSITQLRVSKGAKLLSLQNPHGTYYAWTAEPSDAEEDVMLHIQLVRNGVDYDLTDWTYLTTLAEGVSVLHVYYQFKEIKNGEG